MKKVKLIYNPYSGGGKILQKLDEVITVYQANGFIVDMFRISYDSDLNNILYDVHSYSHLLISGGDGTINQIINIIKINKIDIPIGILPLGTSNDFAKYLKSSKDIKKTCLNIINSEPISLDLGLINNRYFINIASLGLFTQVSQGTNFNLKKILGKQAYFVKGIQEILSLNQYNIDLKGENYEYKGKVYAILVFNGQNAGNIKLAYKASLSDGKFDVLVLRPKSILEILRIIQKIKSCTHLDSKIDGLDYIKTSWLNITGDKIQTDLDGELGPELPINLVCKSESIKLLGIKLKK